MTNLVPRAFPLKVGGAGKYKLSCFVIDVVLSAVVLVVSLSAELLSLVRQVKSAYEPKSRTHQAGAYPGFCSIKRLGILLLPLDGMPVHRRVTPSIKFASTHF